MGGKLTPLSAETGLVEQPFRLFAGVGFQVAAGSGADHFRGYFVQLVIGCEQLASLRQGQASAIWQSHQGGSKGRQALRQCRIGQDRRLEFETQPLCGCFKPGVKLGVACDSLWRVRRARVSAR